jgi:nucleoside-diphosphate-sugar epimerase
MKILFTGASSFTGYWFAKELSKNGHEVITIFTKSSLEDYENIRKQRVSLLLDKVIPVYNCKFGDTKFLEILHQEIDVVCHHGAYVIDYKSTSFSIAEALKNNTNNIIETLKTAKDYNCKAMVITGSVFENNEGAGSQPLRAFSPYGLSKSFTYETFRYFCEINNIKLGKFVIPNPFGPFEEFRLTTFLVQNWFKGNTPQIKTPSYIRDNIHINLLASSYVNFVDDVVQGTEKFPKINPSCYVESQGNFTKRFASEMERRLKIPCNFELMQQTDFSEPLERINTSNITNLYNWNESLSWDQLAEYYLKNIK